MALDIDVAGSRHCAQPPRHRRDPRRVFAGEALSRNIWGSIALTGMAIMALIVLLEWGTRKFIISRRARGAATSS
jgi:hypothetical protein